MFLNAEKQPQTHMYKEGERAEHDSCAAFFICEYDQYVLTLVFVCIKIYLHEK